MEHIKFIRIFHISTVHSRTDTRIFIKECQTLQQASLGAVSLFVADGKGDEEVNKIKIHDIGKSTLGRLGRVLFGSWRMLWVLRKHKPTIVHFHDPELILFGMLLKVIGYKVIYDVHEDVPRQIFSKYWIPKIIRYPVILAVRLLECGAAKFFDAIVPATPKIAEHFPTNKSVVVQNFPISTELFVSKTIPHEQRALSFAYIGGIATIRGIIEMIRAFECLNDITGIRFELVGEFSPSSLEDELRVLPGWAAVHYHGQVSRAQVAQILCGVRSGLVLFHPLPNHIDAQPNKMFEYMSAGLPVIASDFPLWRRIIDGAGCGLLVDPLNPKAIAEAMRWILDHPVEAEAMGWRGRQAVERTFNWDVEATKIINLYNKLLAP